MYCPKCHSEYLKGVARCADCDVWLVDAIQSEPPVRDKRLVTVLEAQNEVELLFAKSLLEEAKVPFVTNHEGIQDLLGLGRLGGYNFIVGPIEIKVREKDEEIAREILKGIGSPNGENG